MAEQVQTDLALLKWRHVDAIHEPRQRSAMCRLAETSKRSVADALAHNHVDPDCLHRMILTRLAFFRGLPHSHSTDRSVTVRINDRGPFGKGRCIDLSNGAARVLGMSGTGMVSIR